MCEGYVEKPLYLLIAEWMMAENRWVIAREISIHFDIEHSKAVNTLTYILSEVTEISCEVKMILISWKGGDASVSDWLKWLISMSKFTRVCAITAGIN